MKLFGQLTKRTSSLVETCFVLFPLSLLFLSGSPLPVLLTDGIIQQEPTSCSPPSSKLEVGKRRLSTSPPHSRMSWRLSAWLAFVRSAQLLGSMGAAGMHGYLTILVYKNRLGLSKHMVVLELLVRSLSEPSLHMLLTLC